MPADPSGDLDRVFTRPVRSGGPIGHLGTLQQTLPVSVERLFENALDWEHLPWLHASSFTSIELLEQGDWGWRARAGSPGLEGNVITTLELRLEREHRRWITSMLDGPNEGSEIWTHVFPVGERSTVVMVDFFSPRLPPELSDAAASHMDTLYRQLYDEDLRMMLDRQAALDEQAKRRRASTLRRELGTEDEVRRSLPFVFEEFGRAWRIVETEGSLRAHAGRCAHQLGSLLEAPVDGGEIVCPWHGYRFDLQDGSCTSGPRCRLERAPRIVIEDGAVVAEFGTE